MRKDLEDLGREIAGRPVARPRVLAAHSSQLVPLLG